MQEAYQTLARREGIPADQVYSRYIEGKTYQCDIAALGIKDNQITFYGETQTLEGSTEDIITQAQYEYVGAAIDGNGTAWAHYETTDSVPYTQLLLLPAETDIPGETMTHFHFRYGNDVEALLASDGWYATMVAYDSDLSLLIGHMTLRDIKLSNWLGTWNNFYSFLEDPKLDETYATLAQREGLTAADVKARYLDGRTYQCDIPAMRIDNESVKFFDKTQNTEDSMDGVIARSNYTYVGQETDDFGRVWSYFVADDNARYPHLFFLPVEADDPGVTMLHFHFRYGSSLDELKSAEGWYATMVKYNDGIEKMAAHMTFED